MSGSVSVAPRAEVAPDERKHAATAEEHTPHSDRAAPSFDGIQHQEVVGAHCCDHRGRSDDHRSALTVPCDAAQRQLDQQPLATGTPGEQHHQWTRREAGRTDDDDGGPLEAPEERHQPRYQQHQKHHRRRHDDGRPHRLR
jgi:hypothetical protein